MNDEMKETADSPDLSIRIDTRYNRIYLHKNMLKAIGEPEYIHLGYQRKTRKLMILGTWTNELEAVHLRQSRKGTYTVHSKALLDGIRQVSGVLTEAGSYLLKGELSDTVPAVSFSLDEAKKIAEQEIFDEKVRNNHSP